MKTLIIYFSQTGNTRKIAECIKNGIIDVTGQCDIKTMNVNKTVPFKVSISMPTRRAFKILAFIAGDV
jgi:menaquinone-dependent protoporphyrinogen IX oxidase